LSRHLVYSNNFLNKENVTDKLHLPHDCSTPSSNAFQVSAASLQTSSLYLHNIHSRTQLIIAYQSREHSNRAIFYTSDNRNCS